MQIADLRLCDLRTKDGSAIDFRYNGVITTTPDVMKIFGMQPDRKTVPFGFSSE